MASDTSRLIEQIDPARVAKRPADPPASEAADRTQSGKRPPKGPAASRGRSVSSRQSSGRRSRFWLAVAAAGAAAVTILVSSLLFFGRQPETEVAAEKELVVNPAAPAPVKKDDPQPAIAADKQPPKPQPKPRALTDGDRLVQLGVLDVAKFKGLKTNLPEFALKQKATLQVKSMPLIAALKQLAQRHRLPIVIDEDALTDEGIPLAMPVDAAVENVPLQDALKAVLAPLQLIHVLPRPDSQAVVITSQVKAAGTSVTLLLKGELNRKPAPPKPISLAGVKPPTGKFTTAAIHRRGAELLRRGKVEEAIAELSRALQQRRSYLPALLDRGNAYLQKRDYRNALRDFNRLIALDRTNGQAYALRAVANEELGFSLQARADRFKAAQILRLPGAKKD